MAKVCWKGSAIFGPLSPAVVSCADGEEKNALTIAWTGIINSHPPMTYISVRPERHSYKIIDKTGEFVINFPSSAQCSIADFCGVRSGSKVNKAEACGFHYAPSSVVSAPQIEEFPLSLECRVTDKKVLGTHTMFIAEIVAVQIDSRYIDSKEKLNLQQAGMLSYLHGEYFALGRKCGGFGTSVMKKGTVARKKSEKTDRKNKKDR